MKALRRDCRVADTCRARMECLPEIERERKYLKYLCVFRSAKKIERKGKQGKSRGLEIGSGEA